MEIIVDGIEYVSVAQTENSHYCGGCAGEHGKSICGKLPDCIEDNGESVKYNIFKEKLKSK